MPWLSIPNREALKEMKMEHIINSQNVSIISRNMSIIFSKNHIICIFPDGNNIPEDIYL